MPLVRRRIKCKAAATKREWDRAAIVALAAAISVNNVPSLRSSSCCTTKSPSASSLVIRQGAATIC